MFSSKERNGKNIGKLQVGDGINSLLTMAQIAVTATVGFHDHWVVVVLFSVNSCKGAQRVMLLLVRNRRIASNNIKFC